MLAMLAGCRRSIVATGAVTGHIGMIEVCWYPAIGGMAALAVIATLNMLAMLACCPGAIVATRASAPHLCMINPCYRHPRRVAVTFLAHVGGLEMLAMLTGCR